MSDKNSSNIPGRITAPAEMLEAAVSELLRRIPDTWQAYRPDDLSEAKAQALSLLTAAGMVERRERLRLRMVNHPVVAEATITFTGESGGIEALQTLVASMWIDWQDAFRQWKQSDTANVVPAHCERLGPAEWRLTAEGVTARQDLDGRESGVFDFVLKRGIFDGKPRMVNGRIFRREPVRGKGALVKIDKAKADTTAPGTVNIGNWGVGGDAFAQAFEQIIAKKLETMQGAAPALPASAKKAAARRGRKKLSAEETKLRREILAQWEQAREAGVNRKQFCADKGITLRELENYKDWARQRRNRRQ